MFSVFSRLAVKLLMSPAWFATGKRLISLTALGSRRPAGMMFPGKASRTYPFPVATRPVTGSTCPANTWRVVAGSKIVPSGTVRPSRSGPRVPLCPVIRSEKSVKPLSRWRWVGTVTCQIWSCRVRLPS